MINLWLDDERLPGRAPHAYPPGDIRCDLVWQWAKTVPEAQEIVTRVGVTNINYMALDHDLGICENCKQAFDAVGEPPEPGSPSHKYGEWLTKIRALRKELLIAEFEDKISYSSCKHLGDGTQFVKWLVENGNFPARLPTVHSMNPDGARRMRQILLRAYRAVGAVEHTHG